MTALPMLALALSGCAIGYNHTVFGTKSNFGLDIDTKPPTAEVSLARREMAIAPTFENGQTTPVMASFALAADAEATFPMFAAYSSTFSGGDAAVIMATLFASPDIGNPVGDYSSVISLRSAPTNSILCKTITLQRPGTMHPFAFATDTTAGLKIAWSGTTGQYPDTIRFGVNRKELALAPVFGGETNGPNGVTHAAHMPSFLATVDHSGGAGLAPGLRYKHLQFFATGKAAEKLALQPAVRQAMIMRLDPLTADFAKATLTAVAPELQARRVALIKRLDPPSFTEAQAKQVLDATGHAVESGKTAKQSLRIVLSRADEEAVKTLETAFNNVR
jgi:hypothetical protein